ncbi:MAG: tRNA pseudouridine(55) synthase TruB [Succinatimonas sp.]|nr:tRNA pseudouridine(55) synthase TruB [Succinatimonas sp.]
MPESTVYRHIQSRMPKRDVSGVFLLNKPSGLSSASALARVRGIFRANKGGHAGALDPLASGLLPVLLGESAKFASFFLEGRKKYIAEGTLGITTTTCDAEGEILEKKEISGCIDRLDDAIKAFCGTITQIPPVYSAVKVAGKPLYKYARSGREVEIPSRQVEIYSIKVLERSQDRFKIEVYCSKGTYIRTLVADIGNFLGCGAYVTYLHRTFVEGLPERMTSLDELQQLSDRAAACKDYSSLDSMLLSTGELMGRLPRIYLPEHRLQTLMHGMRQRDLDDCRFEGALGNDPLVKFSLWGKDTFLGVGHVDKGVLVLDRMMSDPFLTKKR